MARSQPDELCFFKDIKMFKTLKNSFQMENPRPKLGLGFLLRWGGGVVVAALEFQAIYTLLSVWE